MQRVTGRLVINERTSKYGDFNVGVLYSSIGDFCVKYNGLDEFNEGTYSGEFVIASTFQRTRPFMVGIIVEPVAEIEAIFLDDAQEGNQDEIPPAIIDPVEEEMEQTSDQLQFNSDAAGTPKASEAESEEDLAELFGEYWPLGDMLKLDPTIERIKFRKQRDYLKCAGYRFQSKEQNWVL